MATHRRGEGLYDTATGELLVTEPVPDADSSDNNDAADVVGNKTDAASSTADEASLVAMVRQILTVAPALFNVPAVDSTLNNQINDVIGNKEDAASDTADIASLVALVRQILGVIDLTVSTANSTDNVDTPDVVGNKEDVASDTANQASLVALARKSVEEILEVQGHHHNYERWIGPAASASGETHIADPLGDVTTSFTLTSGTQGVWGTALQIFGSTDAAVILPTGRQALFDLHRLMPTNANVNTKSWLLRIIAGTSAAAGLTAETFVVLPLFIENTNKAMMPVEMISQRQTAGTKMWAQLMSIDAGDTKTGDLQFGVHGYPA